MDPALFSRLDALPPLGSVPSAQPPCKVCGSRAKLFDAVDFNKCCNEGLGFGVADIAVSYYRCEACEFIFTDIMDDWTPREMAQFVYNADYIKVDPEYAAARPFAMAETISGRLRGCEEMRILDYGSGSGKFAEAMGSRGFARVESYDPFSCPDPPRGTFDIVISSEVIEHVPRPVQTLNSIAQMLSPSGAVLFTQCLQPEFIDELRGRWWYIAPRNGHISMFADRTFGVMASRLGLTYYRGSGLYGFAKAGTSERLAAALNRAAHPVHLRRLLTTDGDTSWHGVEKDGTRSFRWSRVRDVRWPSAQFTEGMTTFVVPFVHEVRPGFAAESTIAIDGRTIPTAVRSAALVAETNVAGGLHAVSIRTPEPASPRSLRGVPDDRPLGLAVVASDELSRLQTA